MTSMKPETLMTLAHCGNIMLTLACNWRHPLTDPFLSICKWTSLPTCSQSSAEKALRCLKHSDVRRKNESKIFNANDKTLLPLANSLYMGANIPGKKREQLSYISGAHHYEKVCRASLNRWEGFDVAYEEDKNGEEERE